MTNGCKLDTEQQSVWHSSAHHSDLGPTAQVSCQNCICAEPSSRRHHNSKHGELCSPEGLVEPVGAILLGPIEDVAESARELGIEALANELLEVVHRWWLLDHVQKTCHGLALSGPALREDFPVSRIVT